MKSEKHPQKNKDQLGSLCVSLSWFSLFLRKQKKRTLYYFYFLIGYKMAYRMVIYGYKMVVGLES